MIELSMNLPNEILRQLFFIIWEEYSVYNHSIAPLQLVCKRWNHISNDLLETEYKTWVLNEKIILI